MHNHLMRPVSGLVASCVLSALLTGCSDSPPPGAQESPSPVVIPPQEPRAKLAGLVAAALDHRFTATYTYTPRNAAARSVAVTLGVDGTWRIDIPGGALGGAADIALVGLQDTIYQCGAAPANPANVQPSAPPAAPSINCTLLPKPLTAKYDVRLQHLFTDWQGPLTNPSAALSVAVTTLLEGATGTCFSVESTSASLAAPVDPGIYCYADDGTLTAARIGAGTLVLAGAPSGPPATVSLPGPVTPGSPLQLAALPSPKAAASAQASKRP